MKKAVKISLILIGLGTIAKTQTLQEAINKTENEMFEVAAIDFKNLIAKEPTKGNNYFYYGENYFYNDDLDSALIQFKKGAEVDPTNALPYVGIGKILLWQGKEADANTNLFKAKTLGPKNGNVMMELGEAYTNAPNLKNLPEAIKLLNDAIKLDAKNPEGYILLGDALLEQNPTDGSPAIKQYEKAAELNKNSVKAILRIGKLYQRGKNFNLALDYYKKAEEIDAKFAPAYREKAELYAKANQYAKAVENYRKYLELNNSIIARDRYAQFLFMNKNYADAVKEIQEVQIKDDSSPYLHRILGYAYYELGDKTEKEAYVKGLNAINTFFTKTEGKNFKYIANDFKYKGLLLAKTGNDSLGILEIQKAIDMDPANCDLNSDIGKILVKAKKYDKAIIAFEKKATCPKGLNGQDYFDLGRAYFFGPKDFVKADTCFSKLAQANQTFAAAYFYRGKANVQLDPKNEKWAAKPHYEKALGLVKPEERGSASNKANVIEACEYLGYYYVVVKDNAKAKEYFEIIKGLDANNKKANDFLKTVK